MLPSPRSWGILRGDAVWFVSASAPPLGVAERIGGEYGGEVPASAAFLYSERRLPPRRSGARADPRTLTRLFPFRRPGSSSTDGATGAVSSGRDPVPAPRGRKVRFCGSDRLRTARRGFTAGRRAGHEHFGPRLHPASALPSRRHRPDLSPETAGRPDHSLDRRVLALN